MRSQADPFAAGAINDAFDAFATSQRDWALAANAWGESLMIGVVQDFPRCSQQVVANLSGTRDGVRALRTGFKQFLASAP